MEQVQNDQVTDSAQAFHTLASELRVRTTPQENQMAAAIKVDPPRCPNRFKGDGTQLVEQWLAQMDLYLGQLPLPEDQKAVRLVLNLEEVASKWYNAWA